MKQFEESTITESYQTTTLIAMNINVLSKALKRPTDCLYFILFPSGSILREIHHHCSNNHDKKVRKGTHSI